MRTPNQQRGDAGEARAAVYIEGIGYKIRAKNYRAPGGEVDLIATQDGVLILIEVKTRTSAKFGTAAESITKKKLQRMMRAGHHYWEKTHPNAPLPFLQLDAILITNGAIEHLPNLSPDDVL